MNRWKSTFLLVLIISALAPASAPLSRKSPEYTIFEPAGKTMLLSNFKGKVVVLEFFFVASQHCVRVAQTLNRLQTELGPRGFQSIGIAFDPPNSPNSGPQFVTYLVNQLKLTYPVGYSAKEDVDIYLGRTGNEILNIPQVVVIDRNGVIRATSGAKPGDPKLEDEASLRALLDSLLKENRSSGGTARPDASAPAKKTR
jgi:peroxiredoxin